MFSILCVFCYCFSADAIRAAEVSATGSAHAGGIVAAMRDVLVPRAARQGATPHAISVAAGCDGVLSFAGGEGSAKPGVAAAANTVYGIGSISKQFTAAAVLNALRGGAAASGQPVTLETPVAPLLGIAPGFHNEDTAPVSLYALLTMTANLPNFTRRPPPQLDPWGAVSSRELLGAVAALQRAGDKGSFAYSNTDYFLLSEFLRVSGAPRTLDVTIEDLVFSRAGLRETYSSAAAADAGGASIAKPAYSRRPAFSEPVWLQGSADLYSSVEDLFRWNTAFMEGRAVSKADRDLMLSDLARVDVWTYYGMGWFITHKDGRDTYFHSGSVPGYTGYNMIVRAGSAAPSWCSVSILTNADGVEALDETAEQIAGILLAK